MVSFDFFCRVTKRFRIVMTQNAVRAGFFPRAENAEAAERDTKGKERGDIVLRRELQVTKGSERNLSNKGTLSNNMPP